MSDWNDDAARDLMSLGGRLALLTHGEGSWVYDADENRYLDFLGGIAVNCLGHAHPVFVEAVSRQAATLSHVSNYFASPGQLELAARLKRLAGTGEQGRVFLANSGTEANEMAIKLARLHGRPSGRTTILVLEGAFHGRTMGALSLTQPAVTAQIKALEQSLGVALFERSGMLWQATEAGEIGFCSSFESSSPPTARPGRGRCPSCGSP